MSGGGMSDGPVRSESAAAHLEQAKQALAGLADGVGEPVRQLGVIGGGQMGAGIAATAVSLGLATTVRDVSEESLSRARAYRDKVLARTAGEGASRGSSPGGEPGRSGGESNPGGEPDLTGGESDSGGEPGLSDGESNRGGEPDLAALSGEESDSGGEPDLAALWTATPGWDHFDRADAVIEAVFELPELKDTVLEDVGGIVGEQALVASNTSAIPIRTLATSVPDPSRFIGMHFFSPVDRMPLVELIPHDGTAAETVTRAAALGRQLGKVGVVVGDAPGFFTSRVYARWLVEGVRLLLDRATVEEIDGAAKTVGFPVGPLRAHDEATLNLVLQASITQVAEPVMADRLDIAAAREALQALVDAGVQGRRQGSGFYRYTDGRRDGSNPAVAATLGVTPSELPEAVIGERLLLAFASECYLCWDDGTLCHPDDGDVAAVLGIGFPGGLGGPFHFADQTGHAEMVRRCEALGEVRFPPGQTMRHLAEAGGTFHAQTRRPAPFAPLPEN